VNEETKKTYIVQQGEQTEKVDGRDAAVTKARRWSAARKFRPVQLERVDHKMRMVFRKGELETYVMELR